MVEKKRRLGNGLDVKNVSAQQLSSHHTLQVKDLASYSASQLREASKRSRLGHGMSDSSQLPVRMHSSTRSAGATTDSEERQGRASEAVSGRRPVPDGDQTSGRSG